MMTSERAKESQDFGNVQVDVTFSKSVNETRRKDLLRSLQKCIDRWDANG